MKVREWEGEVVFLHEVADGAADRQLRHPGGEARRPARSRAGRARQVLGVLEQRSSGGKAVVLDDLPLFAHQPPPRKRPLIPIHDMLDQVRPDDLTPRQAIDLIYELKKIRDAARRTDAKPRKPLFQS
jgi:DNA mismatch repair protein MutS